METNPRIAAKIMKLLREISKTPFEGIGQPEPLKYELSGYWSRRIKMEDGVITILSCKFHYDK
ncbi:Txe/YoeB family addiction module toxin [Rhodoflexus sp.]